MVWPKVIWMFPFLHLPDRKEDFLSFLGTRIFKALPIQNEQIFFLPTFIYLLAKSWFVLSEQKLYFHIYISHRYTCVSPILNPLPPPSPPYPSGLSQSTGSGCPASCIKFALAIYFIYDNIHVSVLFLQIIPLSPSSTEAKSLFFTSVSPLLPCKYIWVF